MKITGAKVNQPVQTMGRGSTAAIRAKAGAVAGLSNAQSGVVNHLAEVGAEYIERKERMEVGKNSSELGVELKDWEAENEVKQEFTADEIRGQVPDGSVQFTKQVSMPDGSKQTVDRTSIPRHEVYPYMLGNKIKSLIEVKSAGISNPLKRTEFVERANEYGARLKLGSVLKASKEQKIYENKEVVNEVDMRIDSGASDKSIQRSADRLQADPVEKDEYKLGVDKRLEWRLDTKLINEANVKGMQARLDTYRQESYGSGEKDYLGRDAASGGPEPQLNQEAAIKRLERELNTAKGSSTYVSKIATEEAIKARANGNVNPSVIGKTPADSEKYIRSQGYSPSVEDRLVDDALNAYYEGNARNAMGATTLLEDSYNIARLEQSLKDADPTMTYEIEAMITAANKVEAEKIEAFETYPADYVDRNFEQVQAALARVQEVDPQKDPEKFKVRMKEYNIKQESAQIDLGILPMDVKLMPRGQVSSFKAATRSGEPESMLQQMAQLQDIYSEEKMPLIYNQLLDEQLLEEPHIMAMQIRADDYDLSRNYVTAISKMPEIIKDTTVKAEMKDTKSDVAAVMVELRQSLYPNGANPGETAVSVNRQLSAMENGLVAMASWDTYQQGSYSKERMMANKKRLIDANWLFSDRGVRIPRNKGYNEEQVLHGLRNAQKQYTLAPGVSIQGMDSGMLSPDDNAMVRMDTFQQFAVPGTNGDETGIVWHWTNGDPVVIQNEAGDMKPLETTFKDLEKFGAGYRNVSLRSGKAEVKRSKIPLEIRYDTE